MKPVSGEEARADASPSILRRYHKSLAWSNEHSLRNALRLAEGTLPILIGLQEPCDLADTAPYNVMVYGDASAEYDTVERMGCPTLREIDRLIGKETNKRFSLNDVSILDLNTLHSRRQQLNAWSKSDAHKTFMDVVIAKRPKVILMLTCTARQSPYRPVHALGSSMWDATTASTIVLHRDAVSHECVLVKGFHPSVYLRPDYKVNGLWTDDEAKLARRMIRQCIRQALNAMDEVQFPYEAEPKLLPKWRVQLQEQQRKRQKIRIMEESFRRLDFAD